jgi:hypothetical protein
MGISSSIKQLRLKFAKNRQIQIVLYAKITTALNRIEFHSQQLNTQSFDIIIIIIITFFLPCANL